MNVTNIVQLDLSIPGFPPVVDAKQYDSDTRFVQVVITDYGTPWIVPDKAIGIVNIEKPDGTVCFYEYGADGEKAVVFDGNTATFVLVPQALTVAGEAYGDLSLYNAQSEKLTTFSFRLNIQRAAVPDDTITSTNYYNILTQEIGSVLASVDDALNVVYKAVTLPPKSDATTEKTVEGRNITITIGVPRGMGVEPMGTYDTLDDLRAAVTDPEQADMYNVGTAEPYMIYMWDDGAGDWLPQGTITGPRGKSAYESAQDGGYTDTEDKFYLDLSSMSGVYDFLQEY